MTHNHDHDLPLGYSPVKGRPDRITTQGDTFKRPTLTNWDLLPQDLIEAMSDAHHEAAFSYGDEGAGYDSHLMLAYLLESEAFQKWGNPKGREVWGYQIGTWPPQQVQSEEIARWYVDNPYTGEVGGTTYPVKVVRGYSFNTVWEVVE